MEREELKSVIKDCIQEMNITEMTNFTKRFRYRATMRKKRNNFGNTSNNVTSSNTNQSSNNTEEKK